MKFLTKLRSVFRRDKLETEMAEEMRLHVELQTERNVQVGMSLTEARYAAQREFGNVGVIQQQVREGRGWVWLERAGQDLRYAFRYLAKAPGFTTTAILTLALCIGATTAIFSTVYALMLKPLPFHEPERIVELYGSAIKGGSTKLPANVLLYLDYSKNAASYEAVGLWTDFEGMFGGDDATVRLLGARMTAEIFQVLRVQPVIGSFFTTEQHRAGIDRVAVLTHSFWETQFSENPEVVGKDIRIDGENYRVIGVAPRQFEAFDARVKFIVPLAYDPAREHPDRRYYVGIQLFGRLKPGVTIGEADAEAKTLERHYLDGAPPEIRDDAERSGFTMNVGGVQDRVQPVRPTLLLLQGAVAFVLLIGCVNVANLLLVRSNARQPDLAIRSALGASRGAIARQLILESLVLTVIGAGLGLGGAWAALRVTNFYLAKILPQSLPASLDLQVMGFAMVLTAGVGVLIALIPVFHVLRTNLTGVIQRSSRGASSGRGVRALSSLLVIAQVAVALMLLTGAGLLIRSFERALNVNTGLDAKNVVTGRITLPLAHRSSPQAAKAMRERLVQGMREIPGVVSVALSFNTPLQGSRGGLTFTLKPDTSPRGSPKPRASSIFVTPDYLKTIGLTLVEGRFFEEADHAANRNHAVVDESFARKLFPNGSAIGGRFTFEERPKNDSHWSTIIGVVRDVPHGGVEEKSGILFIYKLMQGSRPQGLTFFLRTSRPTADVVAAVREKVRTIDPAISLFDTGPLEKALSSSFDNRRAVMLLLAAFAGLALFLSALGIYGVLAYDVSQRTREIGIRGALGAARAQVVGMIFRQGLRKTAIGLVAGLTGAWLLSRYMTSLLFEVDPTDAVTFVGVSGLLLAVAMLASWLPARRAAKVDPVVALRAE